MICLMFTINACNVFVIAQWPCNPNIPNDQIRLSIADVDFRQASYHR